MTCREAENLLPVFFDGELDARQMRAVALHSARCAACELELRHLERAQELVSDTVHAAVDEMDFSQFWPGIAAQLTPAPQPSWSRVQAWWRDAERRWMVRVPAFAAAAAIALPDFLMLVRTQPSTRPDAPQVAAVDNAASIESLDTDMDSVAVLNDPETRTTVLWVNDDAPMNGDVP